MQISQATTLRPPNRWQLENIRLTVSFNDASGFLYDPIPRPSRRVSFVLPEQKETRCVDPSQFAGEVNALAILSLSYLC